MKRIWLKLSVLLATLVIFTMWTEQEERLAATKQEIKQLTNYVEQVQKENAILIEQNNELIEANKRLRERLAKDQEVIKQLNTKVDDLEAIKRERTVTVSRGGYTGTMVATSGWKTFKATFYNLGVASTGKTPSHPAYGITRSGKKVEDGITIAVDPRVIPLGTWVQVKYPDGRIENRRADDTGSAIKGHKIDLYEEASDKVLLAKGKINVQIRILKKSASY